MAIKKKPFEKKKTKKKISYRSWNDITFEFLFFFFLNPLGSLQIFSND